MVENLIDYSDIHIDNELPFRLACLNGHIKIVRLLLQSKYKVDIHADDEYAFRAACQKGHIKLVHLLSRPEYNIDINALSKTIFHLVCENGHIEVAQYFLQLEDKIDIDGHGFKAACMRRDVKIVHLLLKRKYKEVNILYNKEREFVSACLFGYVEMVRLFSRPKYKVDIHANNGEAFQVACWKGHMNVIKYLFTLEDDRQPPYLLENQVKKMIVNKYSYLLHYWRGFNGSFYDINVMKHFYLYNQWIGTNDYSPYCTNVIKLFIMLI